mmetsp:Transcript_38359/g.88748  ORF Transcript_38359/g.88748 Transcript_38359/m.88748 type:complete len:236 (-) Transcript_38359:239-946(-)
MLAIYEAAIVEGQQRQVDELKMELEHGGREVEAHDGEGRQILPLLGPWMAAPDLLPIGLIFPVLLERRLGGDPLQLADQSQASHRVSEEVPQINAVDRSRYCVKVTRGTLQRVVEAKKVWRLRSHGNLVRKLPLCNAVDETHEDVVAEGRLNVLQARTARVAAGEGERTRLAAVRTDLYAVLESFQSNRVVLMLCPKVLDAAFEPSRGRGWQLVHVGEAARHTRKVAVVWRLRFG